MEVIIMKKLFTIILAAVLVAAFSITAYAGTNARRGQNNEKVVSTCVQTTAAKAVSAASQKTTCPNYVDGTCTNPDCPNDGVPARDGSGYKGGRTETTTSADSSKETTTAEDSAEETTVTEKQTTAQNGNRNGNCPNMVNGECTNPDCPNGGVPALDGSGYKGGSNGQGNGANGKGNCANAGTGTCRGGRNAA